MLLVSVICTAAINQWRDYERKVAQQAAEAPENPTTKLVKEAVES